MCIVDTVYGWFQNSFTGKEQNSSHTIPAGYMKGVPQAWIDLTFDIQSQQGTARNFHIYRVYTPYNKLMSDIKLVHHLLAIMQRTKL